MKCECVNPTNALSHHFLHTWHGLNGFFSDCGTVLHFIRAINNRMVCQARTSTDSTLNHTKGPGASVWSNASFDVGIIIFDVQGPKF